MPDIFSGRIGIIGAGALGSFYGARLARSGYDVHFLMRSDFDAVMSAGLIVKSFEGDFSIRPPVYQSATDIGICDLVLVGLKSTDNAALPELLRPLCSTGTLVMTMQNGLGNEESIRQALLRLPADSASENQSDPSFRILGGIAFLCSNRIAPGVIHHIDHGWIRIGEFAGLALPRTQCIAAMFQDAGIRCEVYDSLLKARWEKLVWNIPFNGLGVAAHAHTAEVLASPSLKREAQKLMQEVCLAAEADCIRVSRDLPDKMMRNTATMGAYRTSMQIDFEEGRPLELDAIIGEPMRRAQCGGIDTPHLARLYKKVLEADHGRR